MRLIREDVGLSLFGGSTIRGAGINEYGRVNEEGDATILVSWDTGLDDRRRVGL
jgi:hypothetical protein